MNYFQFYRIPEGFTVDQDMLNRKFFEYNKLYRGELYTFNNPEDQVRNLELSELNHKAFKTLSNPDRRMKYLLQLKGIHTENNQVPLSFLQFVQPLEMWVKELLEGKRNDTEAARAELDTVLHNEYLKVKSILDRYDPEATTADDLKEVENFYHIRQYLLRIKELLDTFAQ